MGEIVHLKEKQEQKFGIDNCVIWYFHPGACNCCKEQSYCKHQEKVRKGIRDTQDWY